MSKKTKGPSEIAAKVVAEMSKLFNDDCVRTLGQGNRSNVEQVIPTGLSVFDWGLTGLGGIPSGRVVEVFGPEASSKTALTLTCLAGAQREGGLAALAETEQALQTERAESYGLDKDGLVLIESSHMEGCLERVAALIRKIPKGIGPSLIAWDSLAATQTKKELEEGMSQKRAAEMGLRASVMSVALRVICPLLIAKNCALLVVNQVRMKIGGYGNPETTPGGEALKMHASLRVQMRYGQLIKDGSIPVGRYVRMYGAKNKVGPPFRVVTARLFFNEFQGHPAGWDEAWSTLNHAKEMKLLSNKAQGKKAVLEAYEKLGWTIPGEVKDQDPIEIEATPEQIERDELDIADPDELAETPRF